MVKYHYDVEIDLHGFRADEAIAALEKVLYRPVSQSIMVIHGNGDGVLKKTLRDYLKANTYVREFRCGEELNLIGGDGVTIVYT